MQLKIPEPNYWWLLWISLAPVILAFFLRRRKALSKRKKK